MPDPDHLPKAAHEFFADLARNNKKTWFDQNRKRREAELIEPCRALVRVLAAGLKKPFPRIVGSDRGGTEPRGGRNGARSVAQAPTLVVAAA